LGKSDNFDYIREKSKYTPAEQAEMVKQVQQTIIDLFQHANDMINAEHDRRAMFFALLTVDENDSLTIDAAAHPSHSKMDSFLRKALEDTAFARAGLRDKEWADAYADWADYYWMRYQMAANELASVQENQATIQGKLR
jgi:hypothetical protein